jgi:PilZ domain
MGAIERTQDARIGGERREDRRYSLLLDLRWKLIRRRKVLDVGTGRTMDLSSGGLLFDAGRHLPSGMNVELSIAWPALLHNVAPMQLTVSGKIVRTNGTLVGVRITQHEFRTTGVPVDRNALATAPVPRLFVAASTASTIHKLN